MAGRSIPGLMCLAYYIIFCFNDLPPVQQLVPRREYGIFEVFKKNRLVFWKQLFMYGPSKIRIDTDQFHTPV